MSTKRACINCGRKMKQQFIDLKHCKCGVSWKKGAGYFERSNDMIFSLEKVRKGNKENKTKQISIIKNKLDVD